MVSDRERARSRKNSWLSAKKASLIYHEFKDIDKSKGKFPRDIIKLAYGDNLHETQIDGRIRQLRAGVFDLLEVFE